MPTLEVVSLQQAQLELSLSGKRGAIVRQYVDYINQLETGRAGKLTPDEGESRHGGPTAGQEHRHDPAGERRILLGRG